METKSGGPKNQALVPGHRSVKARLSGTSGCDIFKRCVMCMKTDAEAADLIEKSGRPRPDMVQDYHEILGREDVDGVLLCTSWKNHIDMCIDFMEDKKYVGCEVGGAYSLTECGNWWKAYERTKTPVMLMENCVYGRNEMMAAHMAEQGALGKITPTVREVIAMICGKDWRSVRKIVIIALPIIFIEDG